jgi:F0F1-type ATP synthase assembly protein I
MEESEPKPQPRKKASNYMKYSGFAVQFFVLILIAALLGQKLDTYFGLEKPFITIFLILFFTGGYFYKLYLDLFK